MPRRRDLDLSLTLSRPEQDERLERGGKRWSAAPGTGASWRSPMARSALGPPLCLVFEGWDASGKGRRDQTADRGAGPAARRYRPLRAHADEKRHHYLQRFGPAARLGAACRSTIAPGTGGCWSSASRGSPPRTSGAGYDEINGFERTLGRRRDDRRQFWLEVSEPSSSARFEKRQDDPSAYKLTDEDWRNRPKRPAYEQAVDEMPSAPTSSTRRGSSSRATSSLCPCQGARARDRADRGRDAPPRLRGRRRRCRTRRRRA